VPLGRTGLQVFPLCLGGNVFGWGADEEASFAVLDAYAEAGGNFLDTANSYSAWVPGNRGGESEAIIGRWLAARGNRGEIVIATKCGMQPPGLARDQILREVEGSLERLGVDRIDLFYAHQDDPGTPLEETLAAFGELVEQGAIGAIAASNHSAGRLAEALRVSEERGLPRYEVLQPRYNLIARDDYEGALADLCREEGVAVAPYTPLARGFLTGKYRPDRPFPESVRAGGMASWVRDERKLAVLATLDRVAEANGASPAQVAIAWLLARPEIVAPISSATSPEQLSELIGAADLRLSPEAVSALDGAG